MKPLTAGAICFWQQHFAVAIGIVITTIALEKSGEKECSIAIPIN